MHKFILAGTSKIKGPGSVSIYPTSHTIRYYFSWSGLITTSGSRETENNQVASRNWGDRTCTTPGLGDG